MTCFGEHGGCQPGGRGLAAGACDRDQVEGLGGVASEGSSSAWLKAWGSQMVLALVLVLPFVAPIDLIRWATLCTLSVSVGGVAAPFLHGAGLPLPAAICVAVLLGLYASVAWIVWWNHLLGGARRWAQLSSKLTSQLADQAVSIVSWYVSV